MQAISLYWFAAQQQTSTSRRQKNDLFDPKFSAEFNELSLKFSKQQEVAKKCLKLKQSRESHICGIRDQTDRSRIRGESRNRVLSSFFDFFSLFNAKKLTIKAFFKVTLVSLTLRARTVF